MLEGCTLHFNLDLSVLLAGRTTLLDRQRAPKWGSLRIFLGPLERRGRNSSSSISLSSLIFFAFGYFFSFSFFFPFLRYFFAFKVDLRYDNI